MTTSLFHQGRRYSRKDVFDVLGISPHPTGGNWFTGYNSYSGAHFIFCNVGAPGRTGHDYANRWESEDRLRWYGKTWSTAGQPQIAAMTERHDPVFLFHRNDNKGQFTFAGLVHAVEVRPTRPVEVLWAITRTADEIPTTEEVPNAARFVEGATRQITVNAYERSADARDECIKHYGVLCSVCGFDFEAQYGEIGRDFTHVHHLRRLATIGEQYQVDPVEDLRPVCPNCHAMLHRQDPPLELDDLRRRLRRIT